MSKIRFANLKKKKKKAHLSEIASMCSVSKENFFPSLTLNIFHVLLLNFTVHFEMQLTIHVPCPMLAGKYWCICKLFCTF